MEKLPHGLCPTNRLPVPTYYVQALTGEYSQWSYCEDRAPKNKGRWMNDVFKRSLNTRLDVEIGTGNGFHFSHFASENPDRMLVGIEVKYKPLIQSIRRALSNDCKNVRICRYNASLLNHLFDEGELDDVIIHHPDPWPKKRQWKNRLIQDDFLNMIYKLQKAGSTVFFKTDDRNYFDWSIEKFNKSPYKLEGVTYDLHNSKFSKNNFVTGFEQIFLQKNQPIYYAQLVK